MKSNKVCCYAIGRGTIATVDKKRFDTPRKIGEKVRIKSKLNDSMPFGVNGDMMAMCGKVVTIKDCRRVNYNYTFAAYGVTRFRRLAIVGMNLCLSKR